MATRIAVLGLLLAGCGEDVVVPVYEPAAPEGLDAWYYAGEVIVTWRLGAGWNDEPFRVYSKRVSDPSYFFIAEVTSCIGGECSYRDTNIAAGQSYDYYVAAVDPSSGTETASDYSVTVDIPQPDPPPVPAGLEVVALDGATYLKWGNGARAASDFSFYRVYLDVAGDAFLLGETDSEGFLDLLAENGGIYTYFVSSVDEWGHESAGSATASGIPRPDYHGEWIYAFSDVPASSGFHFEIDENTYPIVDGADALRHFRLETDVSGWWLVPGPGTDVYPVGFSTTSLKCGPASDVDCVDLPVAPTSGYLVQDVLLDAQYSYVMRVVGDDGLTHYGVIRVEMLGYDQNGDAIMIFDWAYQLEPDSPSLVVAP
ncbi:MAG: hypothetical protein OEZ65_09365 [Gemmatimonadota bacterium]|nr:hypothetical protein [Gemmatimonadota bacterium]